MASGGKGFVPVFVKMSKPLEKLKGRLHRHTDRRVILLDYFLAFRKCDAAVLLLNLHILL
jgi:hypothetical protein